MRHRPALAGAAAIVLCLIATTAFAMAEGVTVGDTLSLESYAARLDRLSSALSEAHPAPDGAAGLLPDSAWIVRWNGSEARVPMTWIRPALAADAAETERESALRRLQSMKERALAAAPPAVRPAADARDRAARILQRPEFAPPREPNAWERLQRRVRTWISEHLEALMRKVFARHGTGTFAVWLVIALGLGILVLMVLSIGPRAGGSALPEPPAPERGASGHWMREAAAAVRRGERRTGVHHLYRAALCRMEELGFWRIDRARTHREYLRLLPAGHAHRAPVQAVTRRFETTWYGGSVPSEQEYLETLAQVEVLGCSLASTAVTEES